MGIKQSAPRGWVVHRIEYRPSELSTETRIPAESRNAGLVRTESEGSADVRTAFSVRTGAGRVWTRGPHRQFLVQTWGKPPVTSTVCPSYSPKGPVAGHPTETSRGMAPCRNARECCDSEKCLKSLSGRDARVRTQNGSGTGSEDWTNAQNGQTNQ